MRQPKEGLRDLRITVLWKKKNKFINLVGSFQEVRISSQSIISELVTTSTVSNHAWKEERTKTKEIK